MLPKKIAIVDIEAHGLEAQYDKNKAVYMVGIRYGGQAYIYRDVQVAIKRLQELTEEGYVLVGHHLLYDLSVLKVHGYSHTIKAEEFSWFDTQIGYYYINKNNDGTSLDKLTGQKSSIVEKCIESGLKVPEVTKSFWLEDWSNNEPVLKIMEEYLKQDLYATGTLYNAINKQYKGKEAQLSALKHEMSFLNVLVDMTVRGARVEPSLLDQHEYQTNYLIKAYEKQINILMPVVSFNPEDLSYRPEVKEWKKKVLPIYPTPLVFEDDRARFTTYYKNKNNIKYYVDQQTGNNIASEPDYVYSHCPLIPFNSNPATNHTTWYLGKNHPEVLKGLDRTSTGKYKVDKEFLSGLDIQFPIGRLNAELKAQGTIKNIRKYITDESRLHSSYNYCQTLTGRLSSSEPNLQNIERPNGTYSRGAIFRKLFTPTPSYTMMVADLDSIELAVLAWYLAKVEKSTTMMDSINEGISPHTVNAEKWGLPRPIAKTVIFTVVYGGSHFSLVSRHIVEDEKEAKDIINTVNKKEPAILKLRDKVANKVKERGYLTNCFGNYWTYPDLTSRDNRARSKAERQVFNCLIQGTARDIMHRLASETYGVVKELGGFITNLVHDELIVEIPTSIADEALVSLNKVWNKRMDILPGIRVNGDWHRGNDWYEAK